MMPPHIYPGDKVQSVFVPDDIVRTVRAVFVEPAYDDEHTGEWFAVCTDATDPFDNFYVDRCTDLILVERAPK